MIASLGFSVEVGLSQYLLSERCDQERRADPLRMTRVRPSLLCDKASVCSRVDVI